MKTKTDRHGHKKVRLNVWIDADVRAAAEIVAKETDRPLSSLVNMALRRICTQYTAKP